MKNTVETRNFYIMRLRLSLKRYVILYLINIKYINKPLYIIFSRYSRFFDKIC